MEIAYLNNSVEVELTEEGIDIVINANIQHSRMMLKMTGKSGGELYHIKEGKLVLTLWEIMRLFGPHLSMCKNPPFKEGKLYIRPDA